VEINGDDRWGLLAVLTEAQRQESRHSHSYGAWSYPAGKSPDVNFASLLMLG